MLSWRDAWLWRFLATANRISHHQCVANPAIKEARTNQLGEEGSSYLRFRIVYETVQVNEPNHPQVQFFQIFKWTKRPVSEISCISISAPRYYLLPWSQSFPTWTSNQVKKTLEGSTLDQPRHAVWALDICENRFKCNGRFMKWDEGVYHAAI
jgi:hypothetical protein